MKEAKRKLLTLYLGEKWHEVKGNKCACGYIPLPHARYESREDGELQHHIELAQKHHRTFATWDDLGALISAIKGRDMMRDFIWKIQQGGMSWIDWEETSPEERIDIIFNYIKSLA